MESFSHYLVNYVFKIILFLRFSSILEIKCGYWRKSNLHAVKYWREVDKEIMTDPTDMIKTLESLGEGVPGPKS